jgi:hypothetical protein
MAVIDAALLRFAAPTLVLAESGLRTAGHAAEKRYQCEIRLRSAASVFSDPMNRSSG